MKPIERMAALRRDVWKTTAGLLVLTVAGASVAFGYGRLHFDLPIDWGRVLTLTGLLLTGWGTYFDKRLAASQSSAKVCRSGGTAGGTKLNT
jgi:drug/metabolite transporter (DMT)-like permease